MWSHTLEREELLRKCKSFNRNKFSRNMKKRWELTKIEKATKHYRKYNEKLHNCWKRLSGVKVEAI